MLINIYTKCKRLLQLPMSGWNTLWKQPLHRAGNRNWHWIHLPQLYMFESLFSQLKKSKR